MSNLIEPSNTDLGDSPDSVRKYVEELEFQLGLSETENAQLKQRIEQLERDQAQRDIEQQIKALEGALESYVTAKFYPTTYAIQAFNDGVNHLYSHIQEKIEQLRKGVSDD